MGVAFFLAVDDLLAPLGRGARSDDLGKIIVSSIVEQSK